YRADHACADGVRLGRPEWRTQNASPKRANRIVQVFGEDSIPIVDEVLIVVGVSDSFAQVLKRPIRARMCSEVHVQQATRAMFDDDEHVQHPKRRGDPYEEGARGQGGRVASQERRPAQIAAWSPGW